MTTPLRRLSLKLILLRQNWSDEQVAYIMEFFDHIKILETHSREEILEIVGDAFGDNLIGIYEPNFFDKEVLPHLETTKTFNDFSIGEYDDTLGFYKTKDGQVILEIQV